MWLERFIGSGRVALGETGESSKQSRRVAEVIYKRPLFETTQSFFAALLEEITDDLEHDTIRVLLSHLRDHELDDVEGRVAFWQVVFDRTTSPYARACLGEALIAAGHASAGAKAALAAFETQPSLVFELGEELGDVARSVGGTMWVRYRIAVLAALIAEIDPADSNPDANRDNGDMIRELYSELLDDTHSDDELYVRVKGLGASIRRAVERGELAEALIMRTRDRSGLR